MARGRGADAATAAIPIAHPHAWEGGRSHGNKNKFTFIIISSPSLFSYHIFFLGVHRSIVVMSHFDFLLPNCLSFRFVHGRYEHICSRWSPQTVFLPLPTLPTATEERPSSNAKRFAWTHALAVTPGQGGERTPDVRRGHSRTCLFGFWKRGLRWGCGSEVLFGQGGLLRGIL